MYTHFWATLYIFYIRLSYIFNACISHTNYLKNIIYITLEEIKIYHVNLPNLTTSHFQDIN